MRDALFMPQLPSTNVQNRKTLTLVWHSWIGCGHSCTYTVALLATGICTFDLF